METACLFTLLMPSQIFTCSASQLHVLSRGHTIMEPDSKRQLIASTIASCAAKRHVNNAMPHFQTLSFVKRGKLVGGRLVVMSAEAERMQPLYAETALFPSLPRGITAIVDGCTPAPLSYTHSLITTGLDRLDAPLDFAQWHLGESASRHGASGQSDPCTTYLRYLPTPARR